MSLFKFSILPAFLVTVACGTQPPARSIASGASCNTLKGAEETLASIYQPGAIYETKPLKERVFRSRASQPEMVMGASLSVRADSERNVPHLQRVLSCHANQALLARVNDPLHPQSGAVSEVAVQVAQFGYEIHVRGENSKVGEEIWSRANALRSDANAVEVKVATC